MPDPGILCLPLGANPGSLPAPGADTSRFPGEVRTTTWQGSQAWEPLGTGDSNEHIYSQKMKRYFPVSLGKQTRLIWTGAWEHAPGRRNLALRGQRETLTQPRPCLRPLLGLTRGLCSRGCCLSHEGGRGGWGSWDGSDRLLKMAPGLPCGLGSCPACKSPLSSRHQPGWVGAPRAAGDAPDPQPSMLGRAEWDS